MNIKGCSWEHSRGCKKRKDLKVINNMRRRGYKITKKLAWNRNRWRPVAHGTCQSIYIDCMMIYDHAIVWYDVYMIWWHCMMIIILYYMQYYIIWWWWYTVNNMMKRWLWYFIIQLTLNKMQLKGWKPFECYNWGSATPRLTFWMSVDL